MKKLIIRDRKGITLIALVITIIVLLLLAGVSITMLSGQDGILNKASSAKKLNKEQSIIEQIKLSVQSAMIEGDGNVDFPDLLRICIISPCRLDTPGGVCYNAT